MNGNRNGNTQSECAATSDKKKILTARMRHSLGNSLPERAGRGTANPSHSVSHNKCGYIHYSTILMTSGNVIVKQNWYVEHAGCQVPYVGARGTKRITNCGMGHAFGESSSPDKRQSARFQIIKMLKET